VLVQNTATREAFRTYSEACKLAYLGGRGNKGGGQERSNEQRADGSDLHFVLRVVVGGELWCPVRRGKTKKEFYYGVRGGQAEHDWLAA
jgi:hypothetical protein